MTNALREREQLLTVAEVAMLVGCSAPTVRRWIHEGHLAAHKVGPGRQRETVESSGFLAVRVGGGG